MLNDKQISKEKHTCCITFKIPIDMSFSISMKESLANSFKKEVLNTNQDFSKVIRDMIYKRVGVKDKKELEDVLERQIKDAREVLYTRMNVSKKSKLSDKIAKDIEEFLKK